MFAIDGRFRKYVRLLVRHHALLAALAADDSQIETVEDSMTDLWPTLSDEQQQTVRGISSDLNWLRRGFTPPDMGSVDEVSSADWQRILRALTHIELGHPNKQFSFDLLREVRHCASALDAKSLAYIRFRCYQQLGLPKVGALFRKAAVELTEADSKR